MERLGLGPDVCLARNRRLVYGRMTGWGQDGPLAEPPADLNYIALTGARAARHGRGRPAARPAAPGRRHGRRRDDAGLPACCARPAGGRPQRRGQVVNAAICDGASLLATTYHGKLRDGDWVNRRQANMLDGGALRHACADGGKYVSIGAIEPQFYRLLLERCGIDDPEFQRQWDRAQWPALRASWRRSSPAERATNGARALLETATPASPRCSISKRPRTIRNTARAPASSRPTACATGAAPARARLGRRGRFAAAAHRGTADRPGLVAVRHPGPARTRRHRLNPPPGDAAMSAITPIKPCCIPPREGVATITLNRPAQQRAGHGDARRAGPCRGRDPARPRGAGRDPGRRGRRVLRRRHRHHGRRSVRRACARTWSGCCSPSRP